MVIVNDDFWKSLPPKTQETFPAETIDNKRYITDPSFLLLCEYIISTKSETDSAYQYIVNKYDNNTLNIINDYRQYFTTSIN